MSTDRRLQRMDDVLERRLVQVQCAVEAVHHRHNVSAILRTCDALGIHHVHLVGGRDLQISRGPARGAERWLDLHFYPDAETAIDALQRGGVDLWVADLDGEPVAPEGVPLERPVCIWFGAELVGVSPEARRGARGVVHVPMHGMAQSLNVSVAAGMVLRPIAERARGRGVSAGLSPEQRSATREAWTRREHVLEAAIASRARIGAAD